MSCHDGLLNDILEGRTEGRGTKDCIKYCGEKHETVIREAGHEVKWSDKQIRKL